MRTTTTSPSPLAGDGLGSPHDRNTFQPESPRLGAAALALWVLDAESHRRERRGRMSANWTCTRPDVTAAEAAEISAGYDVAATRATDDGVSVDLILTEKEAKALGDRGVDVKVKKNKDGKSARQLAVEQAESGYDVFRSGTSPAASATRCTASLARTRSS